MKLNLQQETNNIVKNIEKLLNTENRHDRLRGLEREIELLRGYIERIEEREKARDRYMGVEFIKDSNYKLIKK